MKKKQNQPSLFAESDKVCTYCKLDPGPKEDNPTLWNGFFDKDLGVYVCWNCREIHYKEKHKTEFAGMYTEFPVYAVGFDYLNKKRK